MKSDLPKPLILGVVALAVVAVGLLFWQFTKPPEPDVKLPDASNLTRDQIAKMKEADHAPDGGRR